MEQQPEDDEKEPDVEQAESDTTRKSAKVDELVNVSGGAESEKDGDIGDW